MKNQYDMVPTLSEVRSGICRLENQHWPQFSFDSSIENYVTSVLDILTKEFKIVPNILTLLSNTEFKLGIFRAREISSYKNINLIAEHKYPPLNIVKLGRCNFPSYPVFYSSNNPMTALVEVIRNSRYQDRQYCISKWSLIESQEKFAFQTFLQSPLDPCNEFRILSEALPKRINEPFEGRLNEEQEKGLVELLKYLDSLFISDDKYLLSAALSHNTLYVKHNYAADILMYPSAQTKYKGVNLAIHPNFVDNRMIVQRFYILKLNHFEINTGSFNISINKYGVLNKNVIIWKDIIPDDLEYEQMMKEDFHPFMPPGFKFDYTKNSDLPPPPKIHCE